MKKLTSIFLCILLVAVLAVPAFAASASASLTGPNTVRAGDTITLSFNLSGSGIYGASGTLSYDSNQVTLTGTTQKIGSPWAVEFNGNNFVAYDNNLSNPIDSNKTLFTATFKVKDVAVGTNIKISYTGVTASDGNADINVGTVSYSATVVAPLSTNNNLASLTVSNATISPAFNADTTSYTAEVPFEVSMLDVKATAADSKAKVSINSPNLTPNGTTNVTVTVTAENGSTKTYTIAVKRAQDPNYVASGNNDLSGITVEGFLLSPVFDPAVTEYVVWVPYETETVFVSGNAADGPDKAGVLVVWENEKLLAGQDNKVRITCTAENGAHKVYTVTIKRAPAHDGTVEEPPVTEPTEPSVTEPNPTEPSETPNENYAEATGIAWWWLMIVAVAGLGAGFAIGFVLKKKNK